jgi:hypothetical protein
MKWQIVLIIVVAAIYIFSTGYEEGRKNKRKKP